VIDYLSESRAKSEEVWFEELWRLLPQDRG